MGIFSNKQQTDQPFQDNYAQDTPQQPQPVAIDGMLPQQPTPASDMPDPFANQSAPPLDEPAGNDAGSYIMTSPSADMAQADYQQASPAPSETPSEPENTEEQTPPQPAEEPAAPQEPSPEPTDQQDSSDESPITVRTAPKPGSGLDELANIKQDALKQLAPLVPHLEQTPEEKFHTAMMMLQATDDASLVKAAYDAAQEISDEKVRAQALLDIVNEINYFTQQHRN